MKRVCEMNQSELNEFYAAAKKEYEACKAKGLSLILFAALPVGASSIVLNPSFSAISIMHFITVVFPVPGPPVIIDTPEVTAVFTASF